MMKYNKKFKLLLRFLKEKKIYHKLVNNMIKYSDKNPINNQLNNIMKTKTVGALCAYIMAYIRYDTDLKQNEFEDFFYKEMNNGLTKLELFHKFLFDNNAYAKFYNNVTKQHPNLTIEKLCGKSSLGRMINDAFTWRNTKEGFEFWERLHYKLCTYEDKVSKFNW